LLIGSSPTFRLDTGPDRRHQP